MYIYWSLVEIVITCLCTCTHLGRSSHSLYTRGRARRCPHVPVWSPLSVCQRWSRYWSTNTSGAAAAQVLRKTAHHSLHSGTSARLHVHTQKHTYLFSPSHNSAPWNIQHNSHWGPPQMLEENFYTLLICIMQHHILNDIVDIRSLPDNNEKMFPFTIL